ncbi:hypothetical protein ECARS42123_0002, partial [Escherichia coli ARS4.2123]
RPLL